MTTQKAQSKIKSSTIAITILSVLLAVAVAATVVLAAFSATKTSTTTITFGNGLTLALSSTTNNDFTMSGGEGSTDLTITPTQTSYSGDVTIPAIKGQLSEAGFIAYKLTVAVKDSEQENVAMTFADDAYTAENLSVAITPSSGFTSKGNGLYAGAGATSAAEIISSIAITSEDYNAIANYSVTITIKFYAENTAGGGTVDSVVTNFPAA